MVGGRIVAPNLPTCKNRVIDFFVVSNNLAGMVVGAVTVSGALCKPHSPVRLYLKASARTMAVRTLKKVAKFGAVLPHGPALQMEDLDSDDIDKMTNEQRYDMFLSRMEKEVVSLMAVSDKEAKKYIGRTDGPKFVLKNALENGDGGTRKNNRSIQSVAACGWMVRRTAVHE